MTALYEVGKIVNTHGLRGELKVIATTDFPKERFAPGAKLTIETKPAVTLTVKSARRQKDFYLVVFAGLEDINAVEKYKGFKLAVTADQQKPLEDGSYYYKDIIGLTVVDENKEVLGKVTEILSPGPNDVWVIQKPGAKELLLPYLESVVQKIDLETKTAYVTVPKGLTDDAD